MSEHSLREQPKATVNMSKHPNRTEQSQNLAKLPLHPRKPTEVNGSAFTHSGLLRQPVPGHTLSKSQRRRDGLRWAEANRSCKDHTKRPDMLDRMLSDEPVVDGRGPAGTKAQVTNGTQNFPHTHIEKKRLWNLSTFLKSLPLAWVTSIRTEFKI